QNDREQNRDVCKGIHRAQKFANQQGCRENQVNGASVNLWDHENRADASDKSSRSCESAECDVVDFQLFQLGNGKALKERSRATKANPIRRTLIALSVSHLSRWDFQSPGREATSHAMTRLLIGTGPMMLNTTIMI